MTNDNRAPPRFEDLDPASQRLAVEAVLVKARRMRAEAMRNLLRRGATLIYRPLTGIARRISSVIQQRSKRNAAVTRERQTLA